MAVPSQQWRISSGNDWKYIRNVALEKSKPGQCLFADAKGVRMAACYGGGYSSHRYWQVQNTGGGVRIRNKFIGDFRGYPRNYLVSASSRGRAPGFGAYNAAWQLGPVSDFIELVQNGNRLQCMGVEAGTQRVVTQTCNGRDTQQWMAWGEPGAWQWWKNRALMQEGKSLCLYGDINGPRMDACGGSGDKSHRMWVLQDAGSHDLLRNKHLRELRGADNDHLRATGTSALVFGGSSGSQAQWQGLRRFGVLRTAVQGREQCLTLAPNNTDTVLRACGTGDVARQDWELLPLGQFSMSVQLRNRALGVAAAPQCLGHGLKMLACSGSGYTTMRTWNYTSTVMPGGTQGIRLANKYLADLGQDKVLSSRDGAPAMVPRSGSSASDWQYSLPLRAHPLRPIRGQKRALLLHAQWSDRPATNVDAVRTAVFGGVPGKGSLAEAIQISSGGRAGLVGDTVTNLNLGPRPANCNGYAGLRAKAIALAKQRGMDSSRYDYVFIEVPAVSCSWSAIADRPGRNIFAQGSGHKPWMWQHEFGHNLGGPHASALQRCSRNNGRVQIGGQGCTRTSAADPSDTLNGGGSRLYALPYLTYTGWMDESLLATGGAGRYTLAPLYGPVASGQYSGLRIPRRDGSFLMVEFRQRRGNAYEGWPAGDAYITGVLVRIAQFTANSVSNQLVDTTPETATMADAPLKVGHAVDDVVSGKRITLRSIGVDGAVVEVSDL